MESSSLESALDPSLEIATEPTVERYQRYMESSANIVGWFSPESAAIWDILLGYQETNKICGNLLEIGVFQGKSAVMAALHCQANETCVLVDPFVPFEGARQRIELVAPDAKCEYLKESSQYLPRHPFVREAARDFRWIHIDGEHTAQAVSNDLAIAETSVERPRHISPRRLPFSKLSADLTGRLPLSRRNARPANADLVRL